MTNQPEIGQTRIAYTSAGTRLVVHITSVDGEGSTGWDVWGYRAGKSMLRHHRTSMYPNRYFIPKGAA